MEEEKAAAYYDELTRKGGGAARFKQGLGYSTTTTTSDSNNIVPERGSALPSSSSFLSNFVRASSPNQTSHQLDKQAQLQSIQNKLKKKPEERHSRAPERSSRESTHRRRSRSRERDRDRDRDRDRYGSSRKRSRSRDRDRDRRRRRSRSRSRSVSPPRRGRRSERRSRSRSVSPPRDRRRTERSGGGERKSGKERNGGAAVDYTKLIEGYEKMTPAERVKAKMKLQLTETAEKDETKGSGWERFEFDKDAPLDDEEMEAVEDDAALVKHIGQSFRFSAVEARREDQIRAAHDEAMFGAPVRPMSTATPDSEPEAEELNKKEDNESGPVTNLISEKVLAKQQGSWRDRARKV